MPSSFSTNLRLELQAPGENADTWGTKANNVFSMIEAAVSGTATVAMPNANYTLTTANGSADQARNMMITFTGAITAARTVTIPAVSKLYLMRNATTGGFALTISNGTNSVTLANGASALIWTDGTTILSSGRLNEAYMLDRANHTGAQAISTVTGLQTALDGKANSSHTHTPAQVGLGNVDNTSDANKPVSTATQAALDGKADLSGAIFTKTGTEGLPPLVVENSNYTTRSVMEFRTTGTAPVFVGQSDQGWFGIGSAWDIRTSVSGVFRVNAATGNVEAKGTVNAIGLTVNGNSVLLKTGDTIAGGYTTTALNGGTASGTYAPSPADRNMHYVTNAAAFTFAATGVTTDTTMIVQVINTTGAGAITMSGFHKVTGDSFTTTSGHRFFVYITRCASRIHAHVQALQ